MTNAPIGKLFLFTLLLCTCARADSSPGAEQTALDRYVAAPDPSYRYERVSSIQGDGFTATVLKLTSQTWLTEAEVNHPTWQHWLTVVRPTRVESNKALLFITGGGRDRAAPTNIDKMLTGIAVATKSVVAELRGVPNQPLVFAGETQGRVEDSLIAYTWDKYLRTGDERWPARLPMTKSAVRAMDAVTSFCATPDGGGSKVDSFVVAGGSKRGWTSWTTAAVDKRIAAVIPIVIDTLNLEKSGAHHYAAYGFFAPSLQDYMDMKILDWFGTPEYAALMRIEEPYQYRSRLTMPKFIINAAGDEYFPPDNSQFYFDDLPGVKYLRYVPNADHSLDDTDAGETILACYGAVVTGAPLPKFSWASPGDNVIRVETKDKPLAVKIWQAHNPKARDFRVETLGKVWKSADLMDRGQGVYEGTVEKPAKGWTAFFVEMTYPGPAGEKGPPYKFTTQVKIVPDVLPFTFQPPKR
jgi:PhoPQ-activated pathogenicity-related protein